MAGRPPILRRQRCALQSAAICPALLRCRHDAGVVVQRPDQRMSFEKRQRMLFRRSLSQELV